jgi:outer membrane protein OmpA-like peptidoglycan-associated protein
MVSTVPEAGSNGNEENTLTPLPAPQVQCTAAIPLRAPYEVIAMYSKDSKLVGIGVVLIILTFLLCQESPTSTPSRSTTQSTGTSSPVAAPTEPSIPSPAVMKKKIDDVLTSRTITFQTNSAVLLPEGRSTLGQVLPILQQNHTAAFEIGGHTDNVGAEDRNLALSENRAKAVMDYLVSKGVASNRLTFKGYGASRPLADNATADGRSRNRRIEFLVRVKGEQP